MPGTLWNNPFNIDKLDSNSYNDKSPSKIEGVDNKGFTKVR